MSNAAKAAAARDFARKTHKALAQRGVWLIGTQALPGTGDMPWANAETGYIVDDNGTGRVLTFAQVLEVAKR